MSSMLLLLLLAQGSCSTAGGHAVPSVSGMPLDHVYQYSAGDPGVFTSESNLLLTVLAGQPTTISSHHLLFISAVIPAQDVVYHVIRHLDVGEGQLVTADHPHQQARQFTQADVNAMRVIYIPPSAHVIHTVKVFMVHLSIRKVHSNIELVEPKIFKIRVQLPNQMEPVFKIINPHIQLNQVTTVDIDKTYFEIEPKDSEDPNLTFVITEMPTGGSLVFMFNNKSFINLEGGNEFYLEYFDNGAVQYQYHGGGGSDKFEVLATDGNFELANLFTINIVADFRVNEISVVQFANKLPVTISENSSAVYVTVLRQGHTSQEAYVWCYTQDGTASAKRDFTERPRAANQSLMAFAPHVQEMQCEVFIIDDKIHEGNEEFLLMLEVESNGNSVSLGERSQILVRINDDEDKPKIEFDKSQVFVSEPATKRMGDVTASVAVNIIRKGDTSQESRIRVVSQDGSALKGIDYEEVSQLLVFSHGVEILPLRIRVVYRHDRQRYLHSLLSFFVVLVPEGSSSVIIGEIQSATIVMEQSSHGGEMVMKVLPSHPVVVSLLHYDRVAESIDLELSPGYPLVCVSSCDEQYPFYNVTQELCHQSSITDAVKDIAYSWEISVPSSRVNGISRMYLPFRELVDSTIFSDIHSKVLDPSFFTHKFKVRCVTTPVSVVNQKKILGVSTRSKTFNIGSEQLSICPHSGEPQMGYRRPSFLVSLKYVDSISEDKRHRNKIHIHIEVPHMDGMLPLLSTLPLSNPHSLLIHSHHSSQHICSNLNSDSAFLMETKLPRETPANAGFSWPYQLSSTMRGNKTVQLYRHLDLGTCLWTFDACFDMTQLVDICGGKITSEFQISDSGDSYVTVRVPLFVSYVFPRAPLGWTAVDHRTELEVSFYYTSLLWQGHLNTQSMYDASVQVSRISVDDDGRLLLDFTTVAHFRGQFVLSHHSLAGLRSMVHPPQGLGTNFTLDLVWSQNTWDGPQQAWRAASVYSVQDYSGDYMLSLIPCSVTAGQPYYNTTSKGQHQTDCTPHSPTQFKVPVAFQQSSRPAPLVYSLDTQFTITNNREVFLAKPEDTEMLDYPGIFMPGETIYGRVMWHPAQQLHTAYTLTVKRLYLCVGTDGYMPVFDPTGQIHHSGPQYGCLQKSPRIKHMFLLLDRDNPFAVDKSFGDVKFEAHFAHETVDHKVLQSYPGVDGFTVAVDPLYQINSGYQWYLQVLYTIGSSTSSRSKRSPKLGHKSIMQTLPRQNGTNMKSLRLHDPTVKSTTSILKTNISNFMITILVTLLITTGIAITLWKWCTNSRQQCKHHRVPLNSCTTVSMNANKQVKVRTLPMTIRNNINAYEGTEV